MYLGGIHRRVPLKQALRFVSPRYLDYKYLSPLTHLNSQKHGYLKDPGYTCSCL